MKDSDIIEQVADILVNADKCVPTAVVQIDQLYRNQYRERLVEIVNNERLQPIAECWKEVREDILDDVIEVIKQELSDAT